MTMRREPVGIYPTLNARAALDLAINVKDYGASGSSSSTTGSMTSGSKTLTLTAAKDFKNGQDISVAGAGASGALLVSSIVSGAGTTTLTLADAAGTTVSAATVQHDDTVAINGAVTSASGSNGSVYLPPGTYNVSSTIILPGDFTLFGAGPWQSTLYLVDDANCDVLNTANDGTQRYGLNLRDFGVDGNAAGQTTAGDGIHLYGMNNATLTSLYVQHAYANGIHLGGTDQQAGMLTDVPMLTNCELWGDETNSTGHGVYLDTGSSDAIVTACDVGFWKQGNGIALSDHPGAVVTSCNAWQCLNGYLIYGVNHLRMIGCLSDLAQHYGFAIQAAASLPVVNVQMSACQARDSGQAGANYNGLFAQGVSGDLVENLTIDNFQSFASAASGISLDNYCSDVNITGGDVSGSDGGIALGTTGMGTVSIQNVRGFNPQGHLTAPTVPTSGTAYTNAFGVNCTVYVAGGTVSAIAIGGTDTGLTAGAVRVAAGQTITLTYTAAPTWTWFGD